MINIKDSIAEIKKAFQPLRVYTLQDILEYMVTNHQDSHFFLQENKEFSIHWIRANNGSQLYVYIYLLYMVDSVKEIIKEEKDFKTSFVPIWQGVLAEYSGNSESPIRNVFAPAAECITSFMRERNLKDSFKLLRFKYD